MQRAIIVKIGNSLGIRIKHQLLAEQGLGEGDEVEISLSPAALKPNGDQFINAMKRSQANGGVDSIPDPVAWQREIRKDRPLEGRR